MSKVVFLSYANSRTQPLPYLTAEDEGIYAALANLNLKKDFDIHRDQFATAESLTKYLELFRESLIIFHFSGHAGGTSISLDDLNVNAKGISYYLRESARLGALKLVVLNGCSTLGQVKRLLEIGVPAVIATQAPIGDRAASVFGISLMKNLNERGMNISSAFYDALEKTETVRNLDREHKQVRGLDYLNQLDEKKELWELFTNDPRSAEINPFSIVLRAASPYVPNEKLLDVLFNSLAEAGNADIVYLKKKEDDGGYVESADKQNAIVNVLPFPIAIHLQKLLCPVEQENEGYDKIGKNRVKQMCQLFHMCMEFIGFIMLAQLWEVKLRNKNALIPEDLTTLLRKYFYMGVDERKSYNYFALIRKIREFFGASNGNRSPVKFFIEELELLREISVDGHPFFTACDQLTRLYTAFMNEEISPEGEARITEEEAAGWCEQAEDWLCEFLKNIKFIHRYNLTSIQNISIRKYRHDLETEFNHIVVRLMRAVGSPEKTIYLRHTNLDNPGVILLKGNILPIKDRRGSFLADNIDFLNISPFVIDRNAFEDNADLSNIMFFQLFNKTNNEYSFKNVKKPDKSKDNLLIPKNSKYQAIQLQFDAFRTLILNEDVPIQ